MAQRTVTIGGEAWRVSVSGRVSQYDRDEFSLVFEKGTGPGRVQRVTRFSPLGARSWDAALSALADRQLLELFQHTQPARTSPVARYGRPA